jgi:hypothetical protein
VKCHIHKEKVDEALAPEHQVVQKRPAQHGKEVLWQLVSDAVIDHLKNAQYKNDQQPYDR